VECGSLTKGGAPPSGEWGPAAPISAIEAQGWAHISRKMGAEGEIKEGLRVELDTHSSFVS
jgi:hypothetical protein